MALLLDNKVCVITGGAGSLGLAMASAFLNEGARVVLIDMVQPEPGTALRDADSDRVLALKADVTQSSDVANCISETGKRFGRVDVLVSNAGTFGAVSQIDSYPEDVFDSVQQVHVKGAFLLCKYGVPAMNDGGSIIIVSSVAGLQGEAGVYAYITAKHAQVGFMRCLAKELAPRKIRVNTLHPGPVENAFQKAVEDTFSEAAGVDATKLMNERIPLGRHANPAEIARSALYLASDMSSFATGSMLVVDGGLTC